MHGRLAPLVLATSSLVLGLALLTVPAAGRTAPEDRQATRTCRGLPATVVGTARDDWLLGTPGRDVVWAGGGDDTVAALGGKDLVCGGAGVDALEGNAGRDRLHGGRGRDTCSGEDREHRHHHSCEGHLDVLGYEVDPPEAPDDADRAVLRATPVTDAVIDLPERRAGAYFASQAPLCVPGGQALSTVHLGKVYFQTYYTQPGWIAIRPAYFRIGDTGFMQGPLYDGDYWTQVYAPADGTVYEWDMAGRTVPRNDRLIWVYEVYWWNGSSWGDHQRFAAPGNYVQTTTGPLWNGAFCWV